MKKVLTILLFLLSSSMYPRPESWWEMYSQSQNVGNSLLSTEQLEKGFRSKNRKFRNSLGETVAAKVLFDTQNRMQRISFYTTRDGTIAPSHLDGISYMTFSYGENQYTSHQYNTKGELEFVYGVQKTRRAWQIRRVYRRERSKKIRNAVMPESKDKQDAIIAQRIEYDFNGNPILNEFHGKYQKASNGTFVARLLEDKEGIAKVVQNFDLKYRKTLEEYYNAQGELEDNELGIARIVYSYDYLGNPLQVSYFDEKSKSTTSTTSTVRIDYTYDYSTYYGLLVEKKLSTTMPKLRPAIYKMVYHYNQVCLLRMKQLYGSYSLLYRDQKPYRKSFNLNNLPKCLASVTSSLSNGDTIHYQWSYNQGGYLKGEEYTYPNGKLANIHGDIAKVKYQYNQDCLQLLTKDHYRNKCSMIDTQCMAKERRLDNTCVQKVEYFGSNDDSYATDQYGVAIYEYEFDKTCLSKKRRQSWRKNNTLYSCRKLIQALSKNKQATPIVIEPYYYKSYNGKEVSEMYYGANAKAKEDKHGIARYVYEYDNAGNMIRIEKYNQAGKLFSPDGIPRTIYQYDKSCLKARSNKYYQCYSLQENYGEDGNLKEDTYGFARYAYQYNDDCLKSDNWGFQCWALEEYYDKDNKLKGKGGGYYEGVARTLRKYDDRGNRILVEYYGKDGKMADVSGLIARKISRYDALCLKLGHGSASCITLREYYNKELSLAGDTARSITKYDSNCLKAGYKPYMCRSLRESYDRNNKLRENRLGIARTVRVYDRSCLKAKHEYSRCVALEEFYDKSARLTHNQSGVARTVRQYDDRGNDIAIEIFNKNGGLKEDRFGAARYVFQYDDKGRQTASRYYNKDNKPSQHGVIRKVYNYDAKGHLVLEEFFDKEGRLAEGKDGIARVIKKYDGDGDNVFEEYQNKYSRPVGNVYGIARIVTSYNDEGSIIMKETFDPQGKLIGDRYGTARHIQYSNAQINKDRFFTKDEVRVGGFQTSTREWFSADFRYHFKENVVKETEEKSSDYVVTGAEHETVFHYKWRGRQRKAIVVADKFFRPVKILFK
ncbi:MAG: hypothetical protein AAF518_02290 [Spirochaetota bacterium]